MKDLTPLIIAYRHDMGISTLLHELNISIIERQKLVNNTMFLNMLITGYRNGELTYITNNSCRFNPKYNDIEKHNYQVFTLHKLNKKINELQAKLFALEVITD